MHSLMAVLVRAGDSVVGVAVVLLAAVQEHSTEFGRVAWNAARVVLSPTKTMLQFVFKHYNINHCFCYRCQALWAGMGWAGPGRLRLQCADWTGLSCGCPHFPGLL